MIVGCSRFLNKFKINQCEQEDGATTQFLDNWK